MRCGVLWDSSAILALLDADDADHDRAVAVADRVAVHRDRSPRAAAAEARARFEILGLPA
jgi:hypothetical protein